MKRILFLIKSLEGGGAEKVLINYLKGLDYTKYKVTVKTVFDIGLYKKDLPTDVEYKTILKNCSKNNMRIMQRVLEYFPDNILRKLFMAKDIYDVEISFLEGNLCKLVSAAPESTKKIAWIHIDVLNVINSGFRNLKDEFNCYKKFDNIICVSNDVKKNFIKKLGLDEKVSTIYNPIDKEEIIKYKKERIVKDKVTICSIGRLVQQKRFDRLIDAISILIDRGYKIEAKILGDGVLREKLQKIINDKRLNAFIELLGFQKNPYLSLSDSDIFVCSSDNEGYSLVVAEALVMGKPVISTDCSGPMELLEYGKYGIIVDKNAEDIADAIMRIIDNNEIKKYGELAMIRSEKFDIDNSIKEIDKLLEV